MKIASLQKFTLIDYPDKMACTVFLSGCNFKCPWCYNPELVLPEKIREQPSVPEKEFFEFLKKRKGELEGVVICGGEPTIHNDLPDFFRKIKKMGFLIKLDTNGSNPGMLKKLINEGLIDYIAMDIKAPKEKYSKAVGKEVDLENIEKSINILKQSRKEFEFRSTIVPGLLEKKDILKIANWLEPAPRYFLQNFRPGKTVNPKFRKVKPYSENYLAEIIKAIAPFFNTCEAR